MRPESFNLEEKFRSHHFHRILAPGAIDAAVLIPVVERNGEDHILFELRSSRIDQGGEVCFPGGRIEAGESSEETVLRETEEELLIDRSRIGLIAPLFRMSGPGGSEISAWLGRITRNLAISRYRKAHAEKRGGGEMAIALEELQTCIPGQSNVEEITESREIVVVLDRFLEGLPEKERNIFLRRYWHVNSVKEIAAAYGAGQGQIAAQLFRTRNKLRAALEKEGIVL